MTTPPYPYFTLPCPAVATHSGFASEMFYHRSLKDGANVRKKDYRPAYLNGPNTVEETELKEDSDGYSDDRYYEEDRDKEREGEGEEGGVKVDSSDLLVEAKSSSSASSFLSSLSTLYSAGAKKSSNPVNGSAAPSLVPDKGSSSRGNTRLGPSSAADSSDSLVTLKPLLFFDLLTSEDSSASGAGAGAKTKD